VAGDFVELVGESVFDRLPRALDPVVEAPGMPLADRVDARQDVERPRVEGLRPLRLPTACPCRASRDRSSRTAERVNVSTRILLGRQPFVADEVAETADQVWVLPAPAPAVTSTGASAAARRRPTARG